MKAVITGDIVDSTKLSIERKKLVYAELEGLVQFIQEEFQCKFEIFRGDSIQGICHQPHQALRIALLIAARLKSIKFKSSQRKSLVDIRLSIGLGQIELISEKVSTSDGPAFRLSGQRLDMMKKEARMLSIKLGDEAYDHKWDMILHLAEQVLDQWSVASAEYISMALLGLTDKEITSRLHISQPAVALRKKFASAEAIFKMIDYYESDKF